MLSQKKFTAILVRDKTFGTFHNRGMQEQEVGGAKLRRRASSEPSVKHGNIPAVGSRFGSLGAYELGTGVFGGGIY
jgi:hypothetical protein